MTGYIKKSFWVFKKCQPGFIIKVPDHNQARSLLMSFEKVQGLFIFISQLKVLIAHF